MNERIKELIKQATECYSNGQERTFDKEKFAELIVQECAELCKKQEYDYWRSSEEQDYTPIDCANAIKEHFGVEL